MWCYNCNGFEVLCHLKYIKSETVLNLGQNLEQYDGIPLSELSEETKADVERHKDYGEAVIRKLKLYQEVEIPSEILIYSEEIPLSREKIVRIVKDKASLLTLVASRHARSFACEPRPALVYERKSRATSMRPRSVLPILDKLKACLNSRIPSPYSTITSRALFSRRNCVPRP